MTWEQREHIATTIGLMDMSSALLKDFKSSAAEILATQCEILQEMLDMDRRDDR